MFEFRGGESSPQLQALQDPNRKPLVTWALLGINLLVWLVVEARGGSEDVDLLIDFGAMFGPLIGSGDYWRLFTAMFLHVGIAHLFFNSLGLFIFGQIVERAFGHARFAIIYVLAGLFGSVFSVLFNPLAIAAGASGAIFGIVGALAAFFLVQRDLLGAIGQRSLVGILFIMVIQFLYGLNTPGVDNWAHLGGLLGGLAIGLALAPRYDVQRSPLGEIVGFLDRNPLKKAVWAPITAAVVLGVAIAVAVALLPDNPFTRLVVAERYYEQRDFAGALAEIDNAIEMDPSFGRSYYVRARVLVGLGDLATARTELSSAIRLGDARTRRDAIALLVAINTRRFS